MKRLLLPALTIGALTCTMLSGIGTAVASTPAKPAPRPALPRAAAPKDTTAPGPVTNLQLTANTVSSVSLGWLNPADSDLAHLVVRRASGATAPAAGQGSLVAALGAAKATVTDTGLAAASTYSYSVFATDKAGNQSTPATITVSTAATDSRTGLRGTLTDAQGRGIGNVLVHIRLGTVDAANTVTSSTGTYSVTNLVPGNYVVCYEPKSNVGGRSATGYVGGCYHQQPYSPYSNATPVKVNLGSLTSRVDDTLAVSGALTGRITGPDGSPVAGVLLSTDYYGASVQYYTVISAADGSYTVKNLPPGNGYSFCYNTDQTTGGYLADCDYSHAYYPVAGQFVTANHTLDVGGIVTGTVRNPAGSPVAGVSVQNFSNGGAPAVTDANGRYRVTGLRSGSYYFCADGSSVPAGAAAPYGYLNGCGYLPSVPVDVQVNQTVTQDFTLTRYAALGGKLTRSDGSPAAHASVYLSDSDGYDAGFLQADAQGNWQQRVRPGSQYSACYIDYDATSDVWTCHSGRPWTGGQPTGDPISVTEGALTTVNDSLLPGASVTGTVTGPDGAPLADAVVSVDDQAGFQHTQATTDSAGHYAVTGLSTGTFRVCFGAASAAPPGYPFQCYQGTAADQGPYALQLATGQHAVINRQLTIGTAIGGRVTDASGTPVQSVTVRLADSAGNSVGQPAYTDSDGKYLFDQLFPGDYTVCFDPEYVYPRPDNGYVGSCWHDQPAHHAGDPVHAVAGVVSTGIDGTLVAGGKVTGTVTDSAGNPVGGMTVQALYSDGTVITGTSTDYSDGSYQLIGLPAVPVAVCVVPMPWDSYRAGCYAHAADYTTATPVTVSSGATVSGIDLRLVDLAAAAASADGRAATRTAANRQG